eukprot:CAMPEP_0197880988 /NCGR_PEP_ID=MMETSP1439-20131203/8618_1 /TAXON_ID=66791 /ORGANISM="Gonyaulax spinifera, Strain CCMP409" /LENGTH=54 /DNA_ID=CAMNT_0043500565 /DNA_START=39 /DNA_END=200 /DNA_ORIENTATION=-
MILEYNGRNGHDAADVDDPVRDSRPQALVHARCVGAVNLSGGGVRHVLPEHEGV